MSNSALIAIGIGAAVILAAIAFITTARRSDVRGAGALSGETRRRDETARRARADAESGTSRADDAAPASTAASDAQDSSTSATSTSTALVPMTREQAEELGRVARHGEVIEAPPAEPVPWTPPDPEAVGVSRRQFFNRATVTLTSAGIGAFSAASFVAFLWPTGTGGFGQDVNIGRLQDIIDGARESAGFFYAPSAKAWVTEYPSDALPRAEAVYDPLVYNGMADHGIIVLYQKCPHLGCRVPDCASSGWFECPCHGSQYNRAGEKKGGPAPRGMDLFPFSVDGGGNVTVQTGTIVTGAVIGTNTTGQEAEGPHCISEGAGH